MAKWHGFGRCKTRLSKDIGKSNSAKIQSVITKHTISVAKSLQKTKLIDISIAISGLGEKNCRRWSKQLGIKRFNLQGKGCLGEKMKRQIIINKKFDKTFSKIECNSFIEKYLHKKFPVFIYTAFFIFL